MWLLSSGDAEMLAMALADVGVLGWLLVCSERAIICSVCVQAIANQANRLEYQSITSAPRSLIL